MILENFFFERGFKVQKGLIFTSFYAVVLKEMIFFFTISTLGECGGLKNNFHLKEDVVIK